MLFLNMYHLSVYISLCVFLSSLSEIFALCGIPGLSRNASFNPPLNARKTIYETGEIVFYSCPEHLGLHLVGPKKRTCQENGQWSDQIPLCMERFTDFSPNLPVFPIFISHRQDGSKTYVLSVKGNNHALPPVLAVEVKYTDNLGIVKEGSYISGQSLKCSQKSPVSVSSVLLNTCEDWTVVLLFSPESLSWKICNEKSVLSSQPLHFRSYLCDVKLYHFNTTLGCGEPDKPLLSTMELPKTQSRSSVYQFSCASGYELIGSRNVTCNSFGTWIPDVPKCKEIECPDLVTVEDDMYVDYDGKRSILGHQKPVVNTTATYHCSSDTEMIVGTSIRTCLPNSTWSGKRPKCEKIVENLTEYSVETKSERLTQGTISSISNSLNQAAKEVTDFYEEAKRIATLIVSLLFALLILILITVVIILGKLLFSGGKKPTWQEKPTKAGNDVESPEYVSTDRTSSIVYRKTSSGSKAVSSMTEYETKFPELRASLEIYEEIPETDKNMDNIKMQYLLATSRNAKYPSPDLIRDSGDHMKSNEQEDSTVDVPVHKYAHPSPNNNGTLPRYEQNSSLADEAANNQTIPAVLVTSSEDADMSDPKPSTGMIFRDNDLYEIDT